MTPEDVELRIKEINQMRVSGDARNGLPLALELEDHLLHSELPKRDSYLARVKGVIAIFYSQLGDLDKGLLYNEESIQFREKIGDVTNIAGNLHNLGSIYLILGDYKRAAEYFERALARNREHGNTLWTAHNLLSLGNLRILERDAQGALHYLLDVLNLYEALGDKHSLAVVLSSVGSAYQLLGELSTSFSWFSKSLSLLEEIGNESSKAGTMVSLAGLYTNPDFVEHNDQHAEELFVRALALAQHSGNQQHVIQAYDALAQLCKTQDRWQESLEYYIKLRDAEKELYAEETRRNSELLDHRRQIEDAERNRQIRLARFQEQEKIFQKILPEIIADRLIEGEKIIADAFANVSIFFSDIVGFTTLSSVVPAKELVHGLNDIFTQFDALAKQHNVEKIKTIGDAYMAVCGAPTSVEHHANHMSEFALSVQELVDRGLSIAGHTISIRIGLHCGDVVAGVIGVDKFAYDLWGDAVNTASRMESHGEAGRVHCSEDFVRAIHGSTFRFAERGDIAIKGKGSMKTYFLERTQQR